MIISYSVATFVLILQFLWLYISEFVGKGLEAGIIAKLLFFAAESMLPMALPIAILLAAVITFGNLGEHFELTAMKSSGISLYRIISPVMVVSVFLGLFTFYASNYIVPYANLKLYSLIYDIRQKHPTLSIDEGIFNYDVEDYVIKISRKNQKTGMMYDFLIYDHQNYYGNNFVLTADSGKIQVSDDFKFMVLELYNGAEYEEMTENETEFYKREFPHHQDVFDKQTIVIPLKGFQLKKTDMSIFKHNYNMLNVGQLYHKIDSLKRSKQKKIYFFSKVVLLNDILKNQIKLRTYGDTVNYESLLKILNSIPPEQLKVIYNIDSALAAMSPEEKKEIYRAATNYVNNLKARLNIYAQEIESRNAWLAQHEIAFHQKFVLSFACLIFFFIGAPLGSIIRKGGFGMPTIVSTLLFLFFYILMMLGERLVKEGVLTPFAGMWLAPAVFIPLEVFVFYKAMNDAVILNYDIYIRAIKEFYEKTVALYLKKRRYKKLRRKREKIKKNKKLSDTAK